MRVRAERELLAARGDVWSFLAEPHHLPDWWPGLAAVTPDRRGVAAGARWQTVRGGEPGWLRRPHARGTLLVRAVDPPRLLAFHLVEERVDVRVELEPAGAERTRAVLGVEGPLLLGPRRALARRALARLYALCQTAAPAPGGPQPERR